LGFMPTTQPHEQETLSQAVARRLRGKMGELQLKGPDIAAAIGMTQGSFSRRYTGSAAWELDELELLQRKTAELGTPITIAYLLGLDPDPAETGPVTGSIMRIEPAPGEQQQAGPAEYIVIRPATPTDRALFTGPIAIAS
jgi:hypothetical protein